MPRKFVIKRYITLYNRTNLRDTDSHRCILECTDLTQCFRR